MFITLIKQHNKITAIGRKYKKASNAEHLLALICLHAEDFFVGK
ncbi:hypothetical protein [Alteromonas gracilis]